MATITDKKTIFFVTSPRSPIKLFDEIRFLVNNFSNNEWNDKTQKEFYLAMSKQDFFEGSAKGDIALKARDRISRAPKSLGLVDLKPLISLTSPGNNFVHGKRPEEAFLRQLLKFQFPSPYHIDQSKRFNIKPYLELMRLVNELGSLSKNEIALFVVQMINFNDYEKIKAKIEKFGEDRKSLKDKKISYKSYVFDTFVVELKGIFAEEIKNNDISTRESEGKSIKKFINTKRGNHLDYADAAIRYLRATGMFTLDPRSFKIRPIPEKIKDIEYFLNETPRAAESYKDENEFKKVLFDPALPILLTDEKDAIIKKIVVKATNYNETQLQSFDIEKLKDVYYEAVNENLTQIATIAKEKLKKYQDYEDIAKKFDDISKREIVDPPLFLEWNVWRSLTMLNDGNIIGNFRVDDDGVPLYPASGNLADIVCKYKDFETIVEVTMSSGQKQYEMEGEPVARHYGDHKKITEKSIYCLFIAPKINDATLAHYYALYRTNIERYGGKAKIIPISLMDFRQLLENAHKSKKKPTSSDIEKLFQELSNSALTSESEIQWQLSISDKVKNAFIN